MNDELGGYEARLLAELTTTVTERTEPRRSWFTVPRLALGTTAVAAVAVAAALTLPVFGGASERSPNPDTAASTPMVSSDNLQTVGYSLAVDNDKVTVTIGDIKDDKALEVALKAEGISANVTYLTGTHKDCQWPEHENVDVLSSTSIKPAPGGGAEFTLDRSNFAHGETLLVAVYAVRSDDGTETVPLVGLAAAKSDPGECVAVDNL